jgi:asparagine synthase (glutamine-hydrolysing)
MVSARSGLAAAGISASRGSELFTLETGDLLVAFEGRLDDIADRQSDLGLDRDTSLAQTIAEGYLRRGDGWVERLRGDYAFVIWDGAQARVLAARDPFGVRPLHYATFEGQLCVASDVDQILSAGFPNVVPDDQMIVEFLTRGFRTLDRSYLRGIPQVPPGHLLIATATETRTVDYRNVPTSELSFSSTAECHEAFREQFFRAVKRRLSPKRPVVVLLSGGIDSTAIVCAAENLRKSRPLEIGPVVPASATYPGLDCDETQYVDIVARKLGISAFRWNGTLTDGAEFSDQLLPAPGSRMPWAGGTDGHVEIALSHGANLVLDGTGGDQVGIPIGAEVDERTRHDWLRLTPEVFRSRSPFSGRRPLALSWAVGVVVPLVARRLFHKTRQHWSPREVPDWLTETVSFRVHADASAPKTQSFLSRGQKLRWRTLLGAPLATGIQQKQRHASSVGLETVFPFLDWDLIQFILALPRKYWPERGWLARLQREALRKDLPSGIYLRRSKAEFSPAMINRVRRSLQVISDLCEGTTWMAGRFVEQGKVRRMVTGFRGATSPTFAAAYQLWAIASVESWLRRLLG